jgi:hypothetical protein
MREVGMNAFSELADDKRDNALALAATQIDALLLAVARARGQEVEGNHLPLRLQKSVLTPLPPSIPFLFRLLLYVDATIAF